MRQIIKVAVAILENDGKILIAQGKPTDKLAYKWGFPGGKVADNESPEECLQRKLYQDFGINISIGEYLGSSIYHYDPIFIELMGYRIYFKDGMDLRSKNHAAIKWVSIDGLDHYDFAPADITFVHKLTTGKIEI